MVMSGSDGNPKWNAIANSVPDLAVANKGKI
jgi:hypothetical protein